VTRLVERVRGRLARLRRPSEDSARLVYPSVPMIEKALAAYRTDRLAQGTPEELEAEVRRLAGQERVTDQPAERAWFGWGHDHDFGGFQVSGRMGTRHVWLLSRFLDQFSVPLDAIRGRRVLDVGCWTGGVSLVLAELGGSVVAIDPVVRNLEAVELLKRAFAVDALTCRPLSIYDLEPADVGSFDTVFCTGIIYHHTDPIVALRRLYHVMRPGAWLCLETMSTDHPGPMCEYRGPLPKRGPEQEWNWFLPAPRALERMLQDTGFEEIRAGNGVRDFAVTDVEDPMGPGRCFAVARRATDRPISLHGPSVPID
jgi:2-polyprenyl-3-methyl-5-hydroxy-6-metoxy-1,4-benzoquinol methylase